MGRDTISRHRGDRVNKETFFRDTLIFRTRQLANVCDRSISFAFQLLQRRVDEQQVVQVVRGLWTNPYDRRFTAYGLCPYLLGGERGYVSFLCALYRHGIISQIPTVIDVATTGHSRIVQTALGSFCFIKMMPQYMREEIGWHEASLPYAIAEAEKALLDCLYFSTRKGLKFTPFPEIELPDLRPRRLSGLLSRHPYPPPIATAIKTRWTKILR